METLHPHTFIANFPGTELAAGDAMTPADEAQTTFLRAQNRELEAQIAQLRAERAKLLETQRQVMELLHCSSAAKIVHDLRNVLNERELLKILASTH